MRQPRLLATSTLHYYEGPAHGPTSPTHHPLRPCWALIVSVGVALVSVLLVGLVSAAGLGAISVATGLYTTAGQPMVAHGPLYHTVGPQSISQGLLVRTDIASPLKHTAPAYPQIVLSDIELNSHHSSTNSHLHPLPLVASVLSVLSYTFWRLWPQRLGRSQSRWHTAAVASPYTRNDAQPKGPPRRIAIMVEPSPFTHISGYQNRFKNLIRCLREAGDEVLVITTGPEAPNSYNGATVIEAPTFRFCLYSNLPLSFGLSRKVWQSLRDFRPDLIHASSPGFMVLSSIYYSHRLKCPLLLSYHTHIPKYVDTYFSGCLRPMMRHVTWSLLRMVHRRSSLTVTVSEPLATELNEQRTSRVPVRVWQRGVDSDLFHPKYRSEAMRAKLTGGHPERPLLLQVGRLGSEKNLFFLKDILARLPADTCLAIVGDGPVRKDLEKHLQGTNTVFTGPMTGQPLWEAYASAEVFVMPSETETLGFVVMEAMAAAVPVVAVRAGGIPDIIQDQGTTGFLYAPGDADEAACYVKTLLDDPALRRRVGDAGREALAPWDWTAASMHLRNEYYVPLIEEADLKNGNVVHAPVPGSPQGT